MGDKVTGAQADDTRPASRSFPGHPRLTGECTTSVTPLAAKIGYPVIAQGRPPGAAARACGSSGTKRSCRRITGPGPGRGGSRPSATTVFLEKYLVRSRVTSRSR